MSTTASRRKLFTIVPWGQFNGAETYNAVSAANAVQDLFKFEVASVIAPIDIDRYLLPNGGLFLDRALEHLVRRKKFGFLKTGEYVKC